MLWGMDNFIHREAKVMAIKDFPVPTTKKQVYSFLGSTNIAACLSDLTEKSQPDTPIIYGYLNIRVHLKH